jgi:hypothetical protein
MFVVALVFLSFYHHRSFSARPTSWNRQIKLQSLSQWSWVRNELLLLTRNIHVRFQGRLWFMTIKVRSMSNHWLFNLLTRYRQHCNRSQRYSKRGEQALVQRRFRLDAIWRTYGGFWITRSYVVEDRQFRLFLRIFRLLFIRMFEISQIRFTVVFEIKRGPVLTRKGYAGLQWANVFHIS